KGLGEMNPEQLWETTMTPENRKLLQVKIDDLESASETFTLVMGDEVEPRRNYIETHAKDVRNLDVSCSTLKKKSGGDILPLPSEQSSHYCC
ncbi:MAG TPA: hypothetical protein ENK72_02040, partial [Epsilonproteobacteria bacterium]|nr:hypothetical protein [Campylobacterota bacterium]